MSTPHNEAAPGSIAKTVLMPGDPLRAKYIAGKYLEDPVQFNSVRNMFGYTGKYKDVPVSVMGSGMGMASIGIYSYELFKFYGVENIIRIGSAGAYTDQLDVLDVVLVDSAYSPSTFAKVQADVDGDIMYPSQSLNNLISKAAERIGKKLVTARTHSTDVFYYEDNVDDYKAISSKHACACVEMESFALFHNANVLGKRAACLLTISDSFVSKKELSAKEREVSFDDMMQVALEAAVDCAFDAYGDDACAVFSNALNAVADCEQKS